MASRASNERNKEAARWGQTRTPADAYKHKRPRLGPSRPEGPVPATSAGACMDDGCRPRWGQMADVDWHSISRGLSVPDSSIDAADPDEAPELNDWPDNRRRLCTYG